MHLLAENPSPSTLYRRSWYQRKKLALIESLGGKCAECGSEDQLTFDHKDGRDWDIRAVHACKRLRIYTEEADAGLIQLLCLSCNSRKGRPNGDGPADDSF
jgi:hypothetical protein